ncbi:MAG: flagellar biosynthetic protein FliR [Defluviitaleaceae bacterium]|nr:flagellar biosynthetic protein FliR [Defluviitaleaceae bacterium]
MDNLYYILEIFENVDIFLLILIRVIGFFVIMPIFSTASIPTMIRVAFAIGFSLVIYTSGIAESSTILPIDNIVGFFSLAVTEFLIGFVMAYIVYVLFAMLYFVGQMLDIAVGFSMVSVMDPTSQIQVPVLGNLLFMLAMALLIVTGGLNFILAAFFRSFDFVPIGFASFFSIETLPTYVISVIVATFTMGLQIAMPIVGSILVIDLALGMLLKSMPQMNMFVIGLPLKIVLGLGILFILLPFFGAVYNNIFDIVFTSLETIIFIFGTGG